MIYQGSCKPFLYIKVMETRLGMDVLLVPGLGVQNYDAK